jgi:predicted secreted Zn-dependent protease
MNHAGLLVAALFTCACASSSPEPASAPTPDADSAALARTALRASITGREQYYDIDGSSAGALRTQIHRLGPKDESGKSRDALTVWSLEWTYGTAQRGDSCALRDVKVTLDVSVTLPRWTPPSTATAQLTDTWRTYLRNVKLHESGHRAIAERNARELMSALTALRGESCDKLSSEATRTAERIVADGRARNRAYDIQTKHGQTQGVELTP